MKKRLIKMAPVAAVVAAMVAAVPAQAQLLWKIEGNGAKGTSYLLGTHHIAPAHMTDSIKGFDEALKSVDVIYGEIDMLSADAQSQQAAVMKYALAPADSMLTSLLKPEQVDSLNKVLAAYTGGMLTAEALAQLKPAMVSTQLGVFQSLKAFPDFNPAMQLDALVQQKGKELNIPAKGFETIDEQMQLLMGDPLAKQAASLMEAVAKDGEAIELAQRLADAYVSQNLPAIAAIMEQEDTMDAEARQRLIYDRNAAWVEAMQQFLPAQSAFVAVGAGHLIGEKGLVQLLRSLGYTVTPVDPSFCSTANCKK